MLSDLFADANSDPDGNERAAGLPHPFPGRIAPAHSGGPPREKPGEGLISEVESAIIVLSDRK